MKRLLFALFATLLLGGCVLPSLGGLLSGVASPAPLERTTIDDVGLRAAWQTFDVALDSINLAIDACEVVSFKPTICLRLKPGTPGAIGIANTIDATKKGLQAAEHAAAAGSATDYKTALAEANSAIADLKVLLGRK